MKSISFYTKHISALLCKWHDSKSFQTNLIVFVGWQQYLYFNTMPKSLSLVSRGRCIIAFCSTILRGHIPIALPTSAATPIFKLVLNPRGENKRSACPKSWYLLIYASNKMFWQYGGITAIQHKYVLSCALLVLDAGDYISAQWLYNYIQVDSFFLFSTKKEKFWKYLVEGI